MQIESTQSMTPAAVTMTIQRSWAHVNLVVSQVPNSDESGRHSSEPPGRQPHGTATTRPANSNISHLLYFSICFVLGPRPYPQRILEQAADVRSASGSSSTPRTVSISPTLPILIRINTIVACAISYSPRQE